MIVFDAPRPCVGFDTFQKFRRTAHAASTLAGSKGTAELLSFGKRIGLKPEWLQKRGEPTEHFDLFDSKIDKARAVGATEIEPRDFITQVVLPKREHSRKAVMKVSNKRIAALLREFGYYRECEDQEWSARSYFAAASKVEVLPPLYRMPEEQLRALDGIGDKLAKLIHGASIGEVPTELLTLRKSIPPSVFSMTKVAGIGPKVAVQLYKKYGVQDLESLLAGVDSGKVKGRVVKLIKISNTIRPIDLVEALILSKHILRHIERSLKHKVVLDVCGSIRRESHLVGDIDIIAGVDDPDIIKQISKEFCSLGIPIMEGEHKLSIYYPVIKGRQYIRVDLFCSKIQSLGAAFLYFTGNLGYNKALRKRAIDLGMTLNEYGLWKGSKNMASKTEKEVCSALGVRFLHPTKRIGADALVLDER